MIRLTQASSDEGDRPVLINPANILSVDTFGAMTRVNVPGVTYYVRETLNDIADLIDRQFSVRDVVKALEDIASRIAPN